MKVWTMTKCDSCFETQCRRTNSVLNVNEMREMKHVLTTA